MDGPCGKLNLVLSEEPRLENEEPGSDALRRAQFTFVPWLEGAQAAYGEARRGRIAEELWIDCLVPSLLDDSLATPGRHVMTCFVQYLPYALVGLGLEPRARSARGAAHPPDRALRAGGRPLRRRAAALHAARTSRAPSASPRATSSTATSGPTSSSSCGRCRATRAMPRRCRALYLCGAGTHPGGGVTGAPGHNAAHRILADLKRDRALRRGITSMRS